MDHEDKFVYCGTTTGDLLQASGNRRRLCILGHFKFKPGALKPKRAKERLSPSHSLCIFLTFSVSLCLSLLVSLYLSVLMCFALSLCLSLSLSLSLSRSLSLQGGSPETLNPLSLDPARHVLHAVSGTVLYCGPLSQP